MLAEIRLSFFPRFHSSTRDVQNGGKLDDQIYDKMTAADIYIEQANPQ